MTPSARFRYRDPSGEEQTLSSVEDLSREIEEGRLAPDTQLLDTGVGDWQRAADLPIVQFIVDELRREGRLPDGWEGDDPSELDDEVVVEDLPLTPDPFEMHLPADAEPPTKEPPTEERTDDRPLHEWMLDRPEIPRESEPEEPPADPKPPRPTRDPWGDRTRHDRLTELEPIAPGERPEEPESRDEEPDREPSPGEIRSRPPPPRKDGLGRTSGRQGRRRGLFVGFLVLCGAVLATAILLMPDGGDPIPEPVVRAPASDPVELELPPFPAPDGGPGSEQMRELVTDELLQVIDSVRAEMGIEVVPPPGWLGGRYLSSASEFGEAEAFWHIYRDFVERLAAEDEEIYVQAARRGWAAAMNMQGSPASDPELDAFLQDVRTRYGLLADARQDGYARRVRVVEEALELHALLLEYENRIQYAPALGQGVSADPILEAVPADDQSREALETQLDRLFEALDQTRSGIPPALGGLRAELFQRLASPV